MTDIIQKRVMCECPDCGNLHNKKLKKAEKEEGNLDE